MQITQNRSNTKMSLAGKVVFITGASSVIGEVVAKHFATLGSKLCLVGRNVENLERVAKSCRETGPASTEVNNAGTANYNTASITSEEEYDEVFDTNLKCPVFLTQLAIPYLKKAKDMAPFGVRVNDIFPATIVSNTHRRPGKMCTDEETYEKFLEAQKGVNPLGHVGLPQDCADAIAFLASDAASFVSGQSIYIDGARHCLSASVATNIMKK